jgi:hypothetical protein
MKIEFTFDTQYGNFKDALILEDDHGLTDDEIEALKQERLTNWVAIVSTMPTTAPDTAPEDSELI